MQNGDAPDAAAGKPAEPAKAEEVTKRSFRFKIWKHMESNGIAVFPRPVFQRIPNFKGAAEAADRLAELDLFKNAKTLWVNPDKPQEFVRIKCLKEKKMLYVPAPRHKDGWLCRLEIEPENEDFRTAVSRKGIEDSGKMISLDESVSLDVVVTGAVAVSKEGYRIGNGRGYSDLEFGLLVHMKAIQPSTVVVTLVHDCQVFDTLPAELFGPHDVPIDIIVTPTQVIETQRMSQRPAGILWHLLSNRRLENMPLLGKLRNIEIEKGHQCPLKEVDTEPEERAQFRTRRRIRRRPSHPRAASAPAKEGETEGEQTTEEKPRRVSYRRNSQKSTAGKEGDTPVKQRRNRKTKPPIDFSVKLSNITPNTRVRDLKQALSERGVKPQIMIWKGFRGFCYLHFIKTNNQKGEGDGAQVPALSMESVLKSLEDVQVREGREGEGEAALYPLLVEPAPPRALKPQPAAEPPALTAV